jgi:hypothetical protein
MRRAVVVLALGLLAGCGESTLSVADGSCVAVVNVDGTFYGPASLPSLPPAEVGPVYLIVTANTGCLDQGQPPVELESGMSNFLDSGTELRRVAGFEPEVRLTYWAPVVGEWLALAPHPAFF